jgi:hypothetical protein
MSIATGHNIPSESIFVDDPIDEQADALDLGLADVTALHKEFWIARAADAGRCTHDQNVSGLERDRFGKDLDRGRNVEDHVARACAQNSLTVEPGFNLQSGSRPAAIRRRQRNQVQIRRCRRSSCPRSTVSSF